MKKILSAFCMAFILWGCEDFLDSELKTTKNAENYPATEAEAFESLTGAYSFLSRCEPLGGLFLTSELMSDNIFGGGGPDDKSCKAYDQFKKTDDNMTRQSWRAHYMGVYRCNFLISKLDDVKWVTEGYRNMIESEVRYLRAHYYFDLSRLFGEVPLVTTADPVNIPKTAAAETYALIASDLKYAIGNLPSTSFPDIPKSNLGRVNKWAAEALMARVFLFYTGYYKTETLPLPDGEVITKAQVIEWLVDCIENSGHDLVGDFRNLWPYAYSPDYKYATENGLQWVGDGNIETVFSIKYSAIANWEFDYQKSNHMVLYLGLRGQANKRYTAPFGEGWGMGTVNTKLWEDWDDADLRKKASIIDLKDRSEVTFYDSSSGMQMDETYLMQKKYTPIIVRDEDGSWVNYSCVLYNMSETNFVLTNTQDLILMRFSDVLLMAAELGAPAAQTYMDRVRGRVGLPSVPVTLENIKAERRFELAFEAVRYFDLLRWHDWNVITDNQTGIKVYNNTIEETKTVNFRPETGGFLPIPLREIELSGGVLTQNPGWDGPGNYFE